MGVTSSGPPVLPPAPVTAYISSRLLCVTQCHALRIIPELSLVLMGISGCRCGAWGFSALICDTGRDLNTIIGPRCILIVKSCFYSACWLSSIPDKLRGTITGGEEDRLMSAYDHFEDEKMKKIFVIFEIWGDFDCWEVLSPLLESANLPALDSEEENVTRSSQGCSNL